MGLSHLKAQVATVNSPGGKITVRGFSLDDVIAVVGRHQAVLSELFAKIRSNSDGSFSLDDSMGLATTLFAAAPNAAVEIIAAAADEPDVELARKLAFPIQIEILEACAKLTFATAGSAKKVLETIIRVANGATAAITAIRQP